jgi:F0F1-type ATP synthase delta subunit
MESLHKHIITFTQLTDVAHQLRLLHDSLYKNQTSARELIETQLPVYLVEYVQKIAQESDVDMNDMKSLQLLIDKIRQELEKTPVAELKIGFTPSYKTVTKIALWWREWLKQFIVVSVVMDEQVVAGVQVSYNGTFADYTLRRWFDEKGAEFIEKAVQ